MCRSKAAGGQRCYSHASKALEKARAGLAAADEKGDAEARSRAVEVYERFCREIAATPATNRHPSGRDVLAVRLRAIQEGEDPAGDDPSVLEDLVGEVVRRQREREAEEQCLLEAMRSTAPLSTGMRPAIQTRRATTRSSTAEETELARLLRTGELRDTSHATPPHPDESHPVDHGQHWFAGAQEDRIKRWGGVPVHVEVVRDLPHQDGEGATMCTIDPDDPSKRIWVKCPPGMAIDGHRGATVTVTNHRTGEAFMMRAHARETGTGTRDELLWVLHQDLAQFHRGPAWRDKVGQPST